MNRLKIAVTKGRLLEDSLDLFEQMGFDCSEVRADTRKLIDTIMEPGGSFYEMLDLGYGKCRFALAVPDGSDFYGTYQNRVVASKYPNVTKAYFAEKGMDVSVIIIEGSVELAPLVGLANGIVDIVQTGTTLKENGLTPIETVAPVSARLIVNTASMKLHQAEIFDLMDRIEAVIK